MSRMHNPAHPGEVLKDWLEGISLEKASIKLGVTRATLSRIVNGRAGISADMALRLSDALGTSAAFWLNMQSAWDLWQADTQDRFHAEQIVVRNKAL